MATTEAKSAIRLKFFEMLFGTAKGYVCFATTDPRAPKATFIQKFFEWPKESLKAENWILKVEPNHNVYFCATLFEKQERKKENCLPTNLLWADLDSVNPDTLEIPAPIVIQSSPGRWQALWRMTTQVPPIQAQEYSRRIAYTVGADKSGWDITQLLRIPLTTNFKYDPPAFIELERCLEATAKPLLFDQLSGEKSSIEIPEIALDCKSILYKYMTQLDANFLADFTYEPDLDDSWSEHIWRVIHKCFYAGMSIEETFTVANDAACNKYARDGRPIEHLWRDVLKASHEHQFPIGEINELLMMPMLVESKHSDTFLDTYREWATGTTDAVPDFHELCILIILSAIVSMSVKIETDLDDPISPNLWGMILGASSRTRKTTAMRKAMSFLLEIDPQIMVASEATSEGLLDRVSQRERKSSLMHRDEVSGMFDSIKYRDYMSGFQETVSGLYDAPPIYTRQLRRESFVIENPRFLILCGGVKERVFASITDRNVTSGFLPRFLIVTGEAQQERRRIGLAKEDGKEKRRIILDFIADLYQVYACQVEQHIGGTKMMTDPSYTAKFTQEAIDKWNDFNDLLQDTAEDSLIRDLAEPTFVRLGMSMMKTAVIFAAIRQKPGAYVSSSPSIIVEIEDVLNAAWYVQKWGKHSVELIINAGKSLDERKIEDIVDFIGNKPGALRMEIMRRFKLTAREADQLMQTIEQRGLVRKEQRHRGHAYWIT